MEDLADRPLVELQLKLIVLNRIIREAQQKGDGRWRGLMDGRRRLLDAIVRKKRGAGHNQLQPEEPGKPEPVVIKMKPAVVIPRAPGRGGR